MQTGWKGSGLSLNPAVQQVWREVGAVASLGAADPASQQPSPFPESGPRGGIRAPPGRPHALLPDSIRLSKLIFDIHSDLEGRHGDHSREVENNIIATNMNYWPPG